MIFLMFLYYRLNYFKIGINNNGKIVLPQSSDAVNEFCANLIKLFFIKINHRIFLILLVNN
jgi:hypothetical protein